MQRKQVLIGGGLLLLIIVGMLGGYIYQANQSSQSAGLASDQEENSPSASTKEYRDSAGFSFQYPENVSVESNASNDKAVYSDLSLTSSDADGDISIVVSDTSFKTTSDWAKKEAAGSDTKDVKLGALSAIEFTLNDKTVASVVDQGILFVITINGEGEEDFWRGVYDKILTTFAFVTLKSQQEQVRVPPQPEEMRLFMKGKR